MKKTNLSFPNFNLKSKPGRSQRLVNLATDQDSFDIVQTFLHENQDKYPSVSHIIARGIEKELGLPPDTIRPKSTDKIL
ncbi:hypothetical protein [Bdellovibrio bacteriovorus]|uniref:hypothetical protein n=1 Tax=Bdellovibrio bacteriovorus TaxID=959 RepID=UPI003AA7BA6A